MHGSLLRGGPLPKVNNWSTSFAYLGVKILQNKCLGALLLELLFIDPYVIVGFGSVMVRAWIRLGSSCSRFRSENASGERLHFGLSVQFWETGAVPVLVFENRSDGSGSD